MAPQVVECRNHTLREIFISVVKPPLSSAKSFVVELKSPLMAHWDIEAHDIDLIVMPARGKIELTGARFAEYSHMRALEGWSVINR